MTAGKSMAIEEALCWAFQREKVHLARPLGLGEAGRSVTMGFAANSSCSRIGAAVDTSVNMGFEAPRDAYALMDAAAALPERYEYELPAGLLPDLAAAPWLRVSRHQGGAVNVKALVFHHAVTGTRPGFCQRPRPLRAVDDGVVFLPGSNSRKPWYTAVRWEGDTEQAVIRQRTAYLVWRIGLESVRDRLRLGPELLAFSLSDALPPIPALPVA